MPHNTPNYAAGGFESAPAFLSGLDPDTAAALLTAMADVVLVLGVDGLVRDMALASDELVNLGCRDWIGRPWSAIVTVESRPKIEALLKDAATGRRTASRQVNHPMGTGVDLPVSYRIVPVHPAGRGAQPVLLAFGRDLRPEMAVQQRLVSAQVSMERDYWRLRDVETRYRLLFQQATEPVLILDAASDKLEEANPAAQSLFGDAIRKSSWTLVDSLDAAGGQALREALTRVRATGRADPVEVRTGRSGEPFELAVSQFRQDSTTHFLVRLSPASGLVRPGRDGAPQLTELLLEAPDAFVVTDPDGHVLQANRAFLELTQASAEDMVRGESLDRWLGRSSVDLNVLVSNLRQHGSVRLFATQLRGEQGGSTEVEISAVAAMTAHPPCLGFTIRDVGRRLLPESAAGQRELPRSAGQMTELVGRVPLRDIVRDTTDLIEQLCIEAALKLTGDNRASAAEMLGLSRQSLYVKLRRFGMGDSSADADADAG